MGSQNGSRRKLNCNRFVFTNSFLDTYKPSHCFLNRFYTLVGQLEEFVKDHGVAGFGSATLAVEQSLERTKANIKWVQRNEKEIFEWLKSQVKLHANGKHEAFPV